MSKTHAKREAFLWFGLTPPERSKQCLPFNHQELAVHLAITVETVTKWRTEYNQLQKARKSEVEQDIESAGNGTRTQVVLDTLWRECTVEGNWNACKAYLQAIGEFAEKKETESLELTPDERARRNLEADRQLAEWRGDGGH